MALVVYNTATRAKEGFRPIDPAHVRLYACGPTVYDFAHIGNARMVVVFDTLARLLRRHYPKLTYVRNITDIDDRINQTARADGIEIGQLTRRTTEYFHRDMAALGNQLPDVEPRATAYVAEMVAMIEILIEKGHAYAAEGHVLFEVATMADYGAFANRSLDEMLAGARVEVAPFKRNAMDFVLWKPSESDLPGWQSPWGRGRPGWHIECSVMAKKHLGDTFDIHGGGQDLVFPHHQNEIAQSHCAHDGAPLANYWMHNGHLMVEGEKMSKSLGNFFTVHDLLAEFPGEALRLTLLASHYRQPMDFTKAGVRHSVRTLDRWYQAAGDAPADAELPETVTAALDDDLNTPQAITALHALADRATRGEAGAAGQLRAGAALLGLLGESAPSWARWLPEGIGLEPVEIDNLIGRRAAARGARDFAEADRIRDDLAGRGVALEDGPNGTTWRWAG